MLRYKTETRPGFVALYDIRPGNVAGQLLQLWSPHGAGRRSGDAGAKNSSTGWMPFLSPNRQCQNR